MRWRVLAGLISAGVLCACGAGAAPAPASPPPEAAPAVHVTTTAVVVRDVSVILTSQFNSFTHPIAVLLALPFSMSGALIALWAGGQSLNIYSMIGLVLLMGIAKKNSIILVDFTNQLRDLGLPRDQALLRACPVRLRPILMTSVSTIAGALPAALALGPGAETRIPMSLAVIGGMVVSTSMTLLVVPAGYSVLDDLVVRVRARVPHHAPASTPVPGVARHDGT